MVCSALDISQSGYRYQSKLSAENAEIADLLRRLTDTHRTWGFGLCYLYLRNVKGPKTGWFARKNHCFDNKRVEY
ncbi:MAG: hypothetical protein BVN35_00240 [Proteobacteria bacterium ST_bin11]|nr:MAG: hypothetical protein BVN35_00240 [Proteobacteria bacterium ST_bin11]